MTLSAPLPRASLAAPAGMVGFATAVVVATEFIVIGLLPQMARDLQISLPSAGHFVAAFALGSAICGPLLMIPASRLEPRLAMVAALLPFALGNGAAVALPGYWTVLAVRILEGAALPVVVSIGSAAVAALAGPGREGRAVSLIYIGVVAGIVVAMPVGTVLGDAIDWRFTFIILGGFALIAAAVLVVGFPRLGAEPTGIIGEAAVLRQPMVHVHLMLSALIFAAMFAPYTYLAALLEGAGLNGAQTAAALMGFGLAGIPGNAIAGNLSDRGATRATAGAALLLAATMAALPFTAASPVFWPLLALWGAVHAGAFLICQIRVMQAAPAAPAFGGALNISAANLGIAAGAATGGELVHRGGMDAAILGGGALALAALALAAAMVRSGER